MLLAERAAAFFKKEDPQAAWETHLFEDCKDLDPIQAENRRYQMVRDACNGCAQNIRLVYENRYVDPQTDETLDRAIRKYPITGSLHSEEIWYLLIERGYWVNPPATESSYSNRYTLIGIEVKSNQEANPSSNNF